tara:strand:- start:1116 stop:1469 length:354 start_codon:yes stop_codon:yes gene_type:complete
MGTFTKVEISIDFNKETPKVFKDKDVLKETLIAYHRTKTGDTDRVDIWVDELNVLDEGVEITVSSGKESNAEFQHDTILGYVREHFKDDVAMFQSSGYQSCDIGVSLDQEEWDEYVE